MTAPQTLFELHGFRVDCSTIGRVDVWHDGYRYTFSQRDLADEIERTEKYLVVLKAAQAEAARQRDYGYDSATGERSEPR